MVYLSVAKSGSTRGKGQLKGSTSTTPQIEQVLHHGVQSYVMTIVGLSTVK